MDIIREYLFQIVLFLAGALIGVIAAIQERSFNKILAWILAIILIGASAIWAYIEINRPELCPYRGETDEITIQNIIHAEEKAVLNEDIAMIEQVFLPGATIRNLGSGVTAPVIPYYQQIFKEADFLEIQHYDIKVLKVEGMNAWVTSSDAGVMFLKNTGERLDYVNPPNSNHYIFTRDESGCWQMSLFSIQAQDESFP
ncbi:MAG: hypothetical protein IPP66_15290 [Anaerolineales bacterium]|nr:hypothetical protein [Anaerolineales bacterium]